jgi:hypothetical protein
MRRNHTRFLVAFSTVLVLMGLFIAFVLVPIPLFPHHCRVDNLDVYSDRPFTEEILTQLEAASRRVKDAPLFNREISTRIFLAHDPAHYAFFTTLARRRAQSQALVLTHVGTIFVSMDWLKTVRKRTRGQPRHTRLEGTLPEAIAHEFAHVNLSRRLGYRKALSLPQWKSEGWADYSASHPAARDRAEEDLRQRVLLVLDDNFWVPPRSGIDRRHVRWQTMVEYLAVVRDLNVDEIMDPSVDEDGTWKQVRLWVAEDTGVES